MNASSRISIILIENIKLHKKYNSINLLYLLSLFHGNSDFIKKILKTKYWSKQNGSTLTLEKNLQLYNFSCHFDYIYNKESF